MDIKNLAATCRRFFTTKDGSEIRELLAQRNSVIRNQSLAERGCPWAAQHQEHYDPRTEEIYYITHGTGKIRIEGETREIGQGTRSPSRLARSTNFGTPARDVAPALLLRACL